MTAKTHLCLIYKLLMFVILGFLRDLVETSHVFLKVMEHMAKAKHLTVGKKVKKRKVKKGQSKKSAKTGQVSCNYKLTLKV